MQGATENEQLIGAARSNNEALLESLLKGKNAAEISELVNNLRDPIGNTLLHLAASNGAYDVIDLLLDQEGVEIDPINRLQGNTPLHCAVDYAVGEPEVGVAVVELLIEAGADPMPKNVRGKRAIDLAAGNINLVQILRGAMYAADMQSEVGGADGGDGEVDDGDVGIEEGEPSDDGVSVSE